MGKHIEEQVINHSIYTFIKKFIFYSCESKIHHFFLTTKLTLTIVFEYNYSKTSSRSNNFSGLKNEPCFGGQEKYCFPS